MRAISIIGIGLWCAMAGCLFGQDQPQAELLREAEQFFQGGQASDALEAVSKVIAAENKNVRAYLLRARIHQSLEKHNQAVEDYSRVISLMSDETPPEVYQHRGSERFKAGRIEESIADFDKYIALRPQQERSHWQRGIAYYYAGRYRDGARQFEGYQTFDDNDVENAVWRYLCQAREEGVEKARTSLLKIKNDPRVPMMTVYALFAGEAKPTDVLAAARAGNPSERELNQRLFYAHLYLGLYFEVHQDAAQARQHIEKAARDHRIGHYMWDVANVHAQQFRNAKRSGANGSAG